ncbi:Protein mono-ADP-ribosyltransferase PARP3 [Dissostichus eleginoides]|uniref:Protein mono-ADP-ribosyltransferase PARP3 n=1 Tax=Dissostichus eleginoides TaxID=100907 RepID=A0AAD9ETF3_DISEL|nr:Protein mono-ADP-ribosyltransferase PARP3 [Dissostichus eleginoides]
MQCNWAEDDFDVPPGIGRIGLFAPGDNRKYVMYHGTTRAIAQSIQATGFCQSTDGMLGRGVYLSRDQQKASRYPIDHPEHDRAVIKVLVNEGKVIAINRQYHPKQKTWHDGGFDTAWAPAKCGMVKSGLEEDCVWDPSQIKILKIINPKPVQATNMQCSCAEDYFDGRLGVDENRKYFIYYGNTRAPAQSTGTFGWGYIDTDTNMQYSWAEDDFDVPPGVGRLGLFAPDDNKEYVMYHGTTRAIAQSIQATGFRQSAGGMLGRGVYLSRELLKASRYPIKHPEHDRAVIEVLVNVGRVIAINHQYHPKQKTWHDYGFDTAWVPPTVGW